MEFGSEVVLLYSKEVLAAAKDAAGVEVVNISAALGKLFHRSHACCRGGNFK